MARYVISLEMDDDAKTVDEIIAGAKAVIRDACEFTWHVAEVDDDGETISECTIDLTQE